jgi:UDP-2,3-diacylglucosamine hydrolase
MHGNRDFLVGEQFSACTGAELLRDYERIEVDGEPVLLMHGDLLCTDDTRYLELRSQLRSLAWQQDFLNKPLSERRRIAAELRALSKTEMSGKSEDIMDVNETAVRDTMRAHDVRMLVHGHTHRPAIHHFELDGEAATRIVLTDWYAAGGYLSWTADGPVLQPLRAG